MDVWFYSERYSLFVEPLQCGAARGRTVSHFDRDRSSRFQVGWKRNMECRPHHFVFRFDIILEVNEYETYGVQLASRTTTDFPATSALSMERSPVSNLNKAKNRRYGPTIIDLHDLFDTALLYDQVMHRRSGNDTFVKIEFPVECYVLWCDLEIIGLSRWVCHFMNTDRDSTVEVLRQQTEW